MSDTEKKIAEVLDLSKPVSDCPECGGLGEIRSLGSGRKCECLYIRVKTLKRELDRRDEENLKLRKELDKQVEIGFSFECQLQSAQQEIERLQQERAELIEGLRSIRNELDRLSRESRQKWKHEGDMYEQGRADAYDEADMLIRDILKECEVTVE